MRTTRSALAVALAVFLALPPSLGGVREAAAAGLPSVAECPALPPPGQLRWKTGESLRYAIDVLGANAGELALVALPPVGKGDAKELQFRGLARSNSFFSKIRRVRGRSTTYVRAKDMHPRRFNEEAIEDQATKSADVTFARPDEGRSVTIKWKRNKATGKSKLRYGNEAFDPISATYYLRTLDLKPGMSVCFDAYGIRKLWRVSGVVKGIETIRVPAGVFQAIHLEGMAVRLDNPRSAREVHLWFSADERRLPLASLSVFDLGPVRAQLTSVGEATGPEFEKTFEGEAAEAPK